MLVIVNIEIHVSKWSYGHKTALTQRIKLIQQSCGKAL